MAGLDLFRSAEAGLARRSHTARSRANLTRGHTGETGFPPCSRIVRTVPNDDLERLSIDTIRVLSMDAVQKANAGHPGTAMALAPVAYLIYKVGVYREAGIVQHASGMIIDLLRLCVFGSITLIIVLTAGCISSERGTLADSVLSRGISRYQYSLGKWHARLATVLGTFLAMGLTALIASFFLLHEDLTLTVGLVALVTVAAVLATEALGGTQRAFAAAVTTAWHGGAFSLDTSGVVSRSDIVLGQPHTVDSQSMPLGNGSLGVAAWAANGFTAQLNRSDTMPDRLSPGQVRIQGLAAMTSAPRTEQEGGR